MRINRPFLRALPRRLPRNILRGAAPNNCGIDASRLRIASETGYWLVRAFYILALQIGFDILRRIYRLGQSDKTPEYLWPVTWANWTGLEAATYAVGFLLIGACLAAVFLPHSRLPRVLVFLGIFQFSALDNSFGSINHYAHFPIWVSFLFIFAPTRRPPGQGASPSEHLLYLFPVFATQALIGFFYTLSGFNKVWNGIFISSGKVGSFDPLALPLLVLGRWESTGNVTMLGEFFVAHIWLAWPGFLAVIYFELFFFLAVFRPQLHRIFGLALAAFHVGVWLVMGITFAYQSVIVALLFVMSPFAAFDRLSIRQTVLQFPLVGLVWRLLGGGWLRRRRAQAVKAQKQASGGGTPEGGAFVLGQTTHAGPDRL